MSLIRDYSAFFQDQLLVEPALAGFKKFVGKGDSGSLLVDVEQHAIGLIFGGMSEAPESMRDLVKPDPVPQRIEGYGVANPISEILDRLKIELLV